MRLNRFFRSVDVELEGGGVAPVLCWWEPDGDEGVVHVVCHPEELGLVDLKLGGFTCEAAEETFNKLDKEALANVFRAQVEPMIRAVTGEEDGGA